jgi:hypothetical protein
MSAAQRQQQSEPQDDVSHINPDLSASQRDHDSRDVNLSRASMGSIDDISTVSAGPRQRAGHEVSGVNCHTHNVEFYGRSSSVALLSQVQRSSDKATVIHTEEGADAGAIVSDLHNPAFSPSDGYNNGQEASSPTISSHYPQCRGFLEKYFSSIHFIHPIIDKSSFLRECELLWSGKARDDSSFTALYYSILSLGALVGVRDDDPVDGIDNLQWSRRFFDEGRSRCSKLGMVTNLDMVQCYFFMVGQL